MNTVYIIKYLPFKNVFMLLVAKKKISSNLDQHGP